MIEHRVALLSGPTVHSLYCGHYHCFLIGIRSLYVAPELNNELQCNVVNMWEKLTLHLYAWKPRDVSTSKVYETWTDLMSHIWFFFWHLSANGLITKLYETERRSSPRISMNMMRTQNIHSPKCLISDTNKLNNLSISGENNIKHFKTTGHV